MGLLLNAILWLIDSPIDQSEWKLPFVCTGYCNSVMVIDVWSQWISLCNILEWGSFRSFGQFSVRFQSAIIKGDTFCKCYQHVIWTFVFISSTVFFTMSWFLHKWWTFCFNLSFMADIILTWQYFWIVIFLSIFWKQGYFTGVVWLKSIQCLEWENCLK